MAPIGMDGAIWPGATRHLAAAAQEMGLAHMSSTMATASIEDVAAIAPDSAWFQLYGIPGEDHRISFDLMRRADEAGAHVLAVTVDIPLPARRGQPALLLFAEGGAWHLDEAAVACGTRAARYAKLSELRSLRHS